MIVGKGHAVVVPLAREPSLNLAGRRLPELPDQLQDSSSSFSVNVFDGVRGIAPPLDSSTYEYVDAYNSALQSELSTYFLVDVRKTKQPQINLRRDSGLGVQLLRRDSGD